MAQDTIHLGGSPNDIIALWANVEPPTQLPLDMVGPFWRSKTRSFSPLLSKGNAYLS